MKYMIGVDIGTTSTKAVIYDDLGMILHRSSVEYPMFTNEIGQAEQNPAEIFEAVLLTIKKVIQESKAHAIDIKFLSFSSAMHSLIAMDKDDKPLTECITWADNRSREYAEKINKECNGLEIYKRTGTPIHPMSPLSKIYWLKHEHPEIFYATYKWIDIKTYVLYQLFDEYVMDHSIGSATGLMNLQTLKWDKEVLNLLDLNESHLPKLLSTTHILKNISSKYAKLMGLHNETPVIIGASDGVLSNLGVNSYKKGEVAVTIGTSGAIRTIIDKPKTDEKARIFCYVLTEDHYCIGGPVNNGGVVLRWLRDELLSSEVETAKRLGIDTYDVLTKIANRVKPGSNGLIFNPYLAGERAPLWNADAKGSYFGMTLSHKKEHMIRATLEGVLFNLYTVYLALIEVMEETPKQIKATGGFAKSEVWRQMMADIFDTDVEVPESYESSCLGACVLGLKAIGEIDDFDVLDHMIGKTFQHHPIQKNTEIYQDIIPIFIRLSRKLTEEYTLISEFQKKYS